jgi:hypothetical protein
MPKAAQVGAAQRRRRSTGPVQSGNRLSRLPNRVRVVGPGRLGGELVVRYRLGAIAERLEGPRNVELGLCVRRTSGEGVLVVAEGVGKIGRGEAFASFSRRHVHHGGIATAGRRIASRTRARAGAGVVGRRRLLRLQGGYILFQLVEFTLLLFELPLIFGGRPAGASEKGSAKDEDGKYREEAAGAGFHRFLIRRLQQASIKPNTVLDLKSGKAILSCVKFATWRLREIKVRSGCRTYTGNVHV